MEKPRIFNSKSRVAVIALLAMLVTVLLLGYSAYGWMSMNSAVTAQAGTVQITSPTNLEISLTGRDDDWHESVTANLESFKILPASSYSGVDATVWQTDKKMGVIADTADFANLNVSAGTAGAWVEEINEGAVETSDVHYIDIPLYFRTAGGSDINVKLIAGSDITAVDKSTTVGETVRVAFLNPAATAPSTGTDPLVFAKTATGALGRTDKVITGTTGAFTLTTPVYFDSTNSPVLLGLTYGTTESTFAVNNLVARIWVEGQDTLCTAAIGGKTFSVKLVFAIAE